jgi:hypothetical protein
MPRRKATLRVYVERGDKRTFAGALDWPGWSRAAKDEDDAIESLLAYAPRYARVLKLARIRGEMPDETATVEVVQRLAGGGGTDFGVLSSAPKQDAESLRGSELDRQRALLEASWKAFDRAAEKAKGKALSVGPRGGGRTLAKMHGHVLEAEVAYLGQLGSKPPKAAGDEMAAVRRAALAALEALAHDRPVDNPRNTKRPWSPRYFIRRSAWHALDHAWELEDRNPG